MNDNRDGKRASIDIFMNKYVKGVPYMAHVSDISRNGVSLSTLIEPQLGGKRVGLQFQLPGSEEVIYAEGEVVREWLDVEDREGSGIRFTLLAERHRKMIDDYVEKNHAPSPWR